MDRTLQHLNTALELLNELEAIANEKHKERIKALFQSVKYSDYLDDEMEEIKKRLEELKNDEHMDEDRMIECPDCYGEGTYYVDTTRQCTKSPWQECCGGCGHDIDCETCGGTGEIEND